jgi:hypothetical protein
MGEANGSTRDAKVPSSRDTRYSLRPGLIVIEEGTGKFIVKSSLDSYAFDRLEDDTGKGLLSKLLERLEKGATLGALTTDGGTQAADVESYLGQLVTAGIVEVAPLESPSASFDELIRQIRLDARFGSRESETRGRDLRIVLLDSANIDFASAFQSLELPGVEVSTQPPSDASRPTIRLVVSDVGQPRELLELNRRVLPDRLPIIYVLLDGSNALLFDVIPYRTPCLEDVLLFYNRNALLPLVTSSSVTFKDDVPIRRIYQRNLGDLQLIRSLLAPFVAFDALHLRFAKEGLLSSRLLRINFASLEMNVTSLILNPRCSACGSGNVLPTKIVGDRPS